MTSKPLCSVDSCDRPARTRGWCQKHYVRVWRRGGPDVVLQIAASPNPVCAIDGCARPTWSRGWCSMHYKRWAANGDPELVTVRPKGMTPEDAFRHVMPGEPPAEDCWVWRGSSFTSGYGQIKVGGRTIRVHKLAYRIFHGDLLDGAVVRHTCDNPPCVNPNHLIAGTVADNNRDRAERGRSYRPVGQKNAAAQLTDAQVVEMRALYAAGAVSQRQLGQRYGITQSTVSAIVRGQTWRHLLAAQVVNESIGELGAAS